MHMIKKSLIVLGFLVFHVVGFAQQQKVDSLLRVLQQMEQENKSDTTRVNLLNELSWETHRNDPEESLTFAQSAAILADSLQFSRGYARALNLQAIFFTNKGLYKRSIQLNDTVLTIANRIENNYLRSVAYNDMAIAHNALGNPVKAIDFYESALQYTAESDILGLVFTHANLGLTYLQLEDTLKAQKNALIVDSIAMQSDNHMIKTAALFSLADYEMTLQKYSEARAYLQKALRIAKAENDKRSQLFAYSTLADIDQQNRFFESAESNLIKAQNIALEMADYEGLINNYFLTASIYQQQNQWQAAINMLEKAEILAQEKELPEDLEIVYDNLAELYAKIGEYQKAYEYQHLQAEIAASNYEIELNKALDLQSINSNLEKQTILNKELKATSQKQSEELAYQEKFNQALFAVALLILSLGIVLFFAYRNKIKYSKELQSKVDEQTASLLDKNRELENSYEELENFAYITSHDLKEPARNILSFAKMLSEQKDRLPEDKQVEYLQIIRSRAKRMYILLEDVLEFSKLKKSDNNWEKIDTEKIVKTVKDELKDKIQAQNAQISHDALPQIHFAETEMFLILKNLIENGIKYNTSSQPSIHISYNRQKNHHHFSVSDNGIGIDPNYKDKIFDMFFRLHNKQDFDGTGLGLAICKRILRKAKGNIWPEAGKNGGTTFHFTIPAK